jgi:hypothetical protein
MTKRERTEKSRYKHVTTGDHCTCAAFIAERMVMNYAEFENLGSLPFKFWNHKKWNWKYKKQLMLALKLIEEYGEKAVIQAIKSPYLKKTFSLANKRVVPCIKRQKKEIDAQKNTRQELDIKDNPTVRKTSFGKKGGINKLRGLDG